MHFKKIDITKKVRKYAFCTLLRKLPISYLTLFGLTLVFGQFYNECYENFGLFLSKCKEAFKQTNIFILKQMDGLYFSGHKIYFILAKFGNFYK